MINWFDMPAEGLSNGGMFEIKELTATENKVYQKDGEVYNKVTVNVPSPTGKITITENGTDINISQYATADVNVEGGGGSSDFSTAEVTIVGETQSVIEWELRNSYFPYIDNGELVIASTVDMGTYSAVLYKNSLTLIPYFAPTVTGNASVVEEGKDVYVVITGNCTITVPEIV